MANVTPSSYPSGGYESFSSTKQEVEALNKINTLISDLQGTFLPNVKSLLMTGRIPI